MEINKKIEILEFEISLSAIFASYMNSMNIDVKNPNSKEGFLLFIEELINDGSIGLSDYSSGTGIPLTGSPQEQVQQLKNIWPTLENAKEIWPEDPWYYLEWLWWDVTCAIGLTDLPNLEVYLSDK